MYCIKFVDFWSFLWLKEKKIVTLQTNCAKYFITNNFNIYNNENEQNFLSNYADGCSCFCSM